MPQRCDSCREESYVLYLRIGEGFVCPDCEDRLRLKEVEENAKKKTLESFGKKDSYR